MNGLNKYLILTCCITWVMPLAAQKIWSLKACIDSALLNNNAVNQSSFTNNINSINYSQSKWAKLPNLNLTDAQNISSGYSLDPYTYQYTTQNISINNLALNSSVTLFNGYLLVNTVKQNRLVYDASMQDLEKSKNDLRLNVIAAYMQLLMDYEAINITDEQLKSTDIQVTQTRTFVKYGKVAELNLLQVQSQLSSDKLAKVNSENQLQLDKITLQQMMDIAVTNNFEIDKSDTGVVMPMDVYTAEAIQQEAEIFLPQIKSAVYKTDAAMYGLMMAKSGRYPKLTLSGTLKTGYSSLRKNITQTTSYNSQVIGYVNDVASQPVYAIVPTTTVNRQDQSVQDQLKNNFSQALGLNLSVPIFNNFLVNSNVSVARINVSIAKLNEQQVRNDLRKNIEIAYANQLSAANKFKVITEQLELESKTYQNMEKNFSFGVLDATTFLIEKNNYNKVAMSLIQARYDYVLKTKIVDFYLGKPLVLTK